MNAQHTPGEVLADPDLWTPEDAQAASDYWHAEQERRLEEDDGVAP